MPPAFLARLINRESRFDDRAVSPVGALGIAQFMPGTAAMVGLDDPFDARKAIPAAARHLADLRGRFGNWGLAAAAYNAGPGGVERFLRTGRLPGETRAYVRDVAGAPAAAFRVPNAMMAARPLADDVPFVLACASLPSYRMARPVPAVVPHGLVAGRGETQTVKVASRSSASTPFRTARLTWRRPTVEEPAPPPASPPARPRRPSWIERVPRGWSERLVAAATPLAEPMRQARAEAEALAAIPVPAVFRDPNARPRPVLVAVAPPAEAITVRPGGPAAMGSIEVASLAMVVPSGEVWRRMIGPPALLDMPLPKDAPRALRNRQICGLIEREAQRVGMPAPFFARLINQESRFDPNAVSPVGAQGVAQFMPYTAEQRGLKDPFAVTEAIPASADYLAHLHGMLGNWGLAAMGYNAGPGRIIDAFNGRAPPPETRNYIEIITGRDWRHFTIIENEVTAEPLDAKLPFMEACLALPTKRTSPLKPKAPGAPAGVPWQPWGVQLAAAFQEKQAVASFDRQAGKLKAVLKGRRPMLVRTKRRGAMKAMVAARLGAPTRDEAERLCARIRKAGGNCMVMKNGK